MFRESRCTPVARWSTFRPHEVGSGHPTRPRAAGHRHNQSSARVFVRGTTLTIRGSGFQTGANATIGGKSEAVTFVDMNNLKIVTPALNAGKYRTAVSNPDGETTSLDAGFTAS